jgi:hypothetical protein
MGLARGLVTRVVYMAITMCMIREVVIGTIRGKAKEVVIGSIRGRARGI